MKKTSTRMLSAVICLLLLVQMPLSVFSFADVKINKGLDLTKETGHNDTVEILEEDISKRGEYEKHFLQSDGTYLAVSYSDPVHRKAKDGSYEEIDNTLSLKNGRLENADKDFKVSFAEKSEKGLVQIAYDEYAISWGLSSFTDKKISSTDEQSILSVHSGELSTEKATLIDDITKVKASESAAEAETSKATVETETSEAVTETETETATVTETSEAATEAKLPEETTAEPKTNQETTAVNTVSDDTLVAVRTFKSARTAKKAVVFDNTEEMKRLSEKERKVAASKISSGLVYSDVLGDGIDARYSVNPGRIKEDIVLDTPSDFSGYAMDITAEGLTAVKSENNSVEFLNGKNEAAFILQTPYMYDAADNISYDIDIEIEETAKGCRIVFTPSAEWLNAEERVYPIVIDPTLISTEPDYTLNNAHDAYVYEWGILNSGAYVDRMYVGIKKEYGLINRVYRAYWRLLNLPTIGLDYTITAAVFVMNLPNGTETGRPFSLYGVNGSWDESTITWTNRPTSETLLMQNVSFDMPSLTVSFANANVTQRIRDWYSGAKPNYGFMIRYTNESKTDPDYNSFWSCDNGIASRVPIMMIDYTMPTQTMTEGTYRIRSAYSGKYLSVNESTDKVVQRSLDGASNQLWTLVDKGSGKYELVSGASASGSNVLDVDNAGTENGTELKRFDRNSSSAQRFMFLNSGSGTYKIVPGCAPNKVLDVRGPSTADNTQIQLYDWGNVSQQKWILEPAFSPVWPVSLHSVSSLYGWRSRSSISMHKGIDIPVMLYDVKAIEAGQVVVAGFDSDFGNFVKVHHGDGFYSQYMHLDSRMFTVSASDPPVPIGKRQMLGVSGNTGDSEGYHLHFEIFFDDNRAKAVNPLTSYHSGDTRSGWTNPNPLFILSDGQYVFDSGFDRAYTSNEYTSHSTAYRR